MKMKKRKTFFDKEWSEGIVDLETARSLSLKGIDLKLPDPEIFAKEHFGKMIKNCKLDRYNRDSMNEYIRDYAELNSGIDDELRCRKETADRLVDEYTEFSEYINAGIIPQKGKTQKAAIERNAKSDYLKRVAPIPFFLEDTIKLIIFSIGSFAEVAFLYIMIQGILYQNPILTAVVTISATLCIIIIPAICGYELSIFLNQDNTSLHGNNRWRRWQLGGSVAAYTLLYVSYALLRMGSIEVMEEFSTASKNVLVLLTILLMVLPIINSIVIFKIHFYELTSSDIENRKKAEREYNKMRVDVIKNSLPATAKYEERLVEQLQEIEIVARHNLERWIRVTERCWRMMLAVHTVDISPEAVDRIMNNK